MIYTMHIYSTAQMQRIMHARSHEHANAFCQTCKRISSGVQTRLDLYCFCTCNRVCEHVCLGVRTCLAWRASAFETRVHYIYVASGRYCTCMHLIRTTCCDWQLVAGCACNGGHSISHFLLGLLAAMQFLIETITLVWLSR